MENRMIRALAAALPLAASLAAPAHAGPEGGRAVARAAGAHRARGARPRRRARRVGQGPEDGRHASRSCPTSRSPRPRSIKLAVLYELYRQAEEGKVDLAEVTRPPAHARGGRRRPPGARAGGQPDVARPRRADDGLVRQRGHQRADRAGSGMDAVNRRLDGLGLARTRLRRRMMDLEAAQRGRRERLHAAGDAAADRGHPRRHGPLRRARAATSARVAATPKRTRRSARPCPRASSSSTRTASWRRCALAAAVVDLPGRPYSVTIMTTLPAQRRGRRGRRSARSPPRCSRPSTGWPAPATWGGSSRSGDGPATGPGTSRSRGMTTATAAIGWADPGR